MKNLALKLLPGAALLTLALVFAPAARAADQALPVTPTIENTKAMDHPPFVLKLKNDSKMTLKLSATVQLSVVAHNADKARMVPAQDVAAGATMTIADLAAMDKVTVKAEGYAPLEIEIK
ncbi:MAG TPA: hypothetical protein VL200_16680 [Lacunisphaera sp.]|jgi:hypothetical protein|nr:hypothetical protein [Lacunisphaera sp.]